MKTLLKTLAIFCLGAFAFVGCEQSGGDDNGGTATKLLLVADKSTIYDNGEDYATFTLYYDGMTLTEGYELYAGETPLAGNTFSSTEIGSVEVWAAYGTVISNALSINVIATPPAAPAAPEDTNPEKTNFKRRILLTQFTGTGCGNCPYMMNALHQVLNTPSLESKIVIAAAHLYNESDPAYLEDAKTLDNMLNAMYYPMVYADFVKESETSASLPDLTSTINQNYARVGVKGGIAVSSEYHADKGYIVLNATVKAKETTEFRIGAWLLEDKVAGKQTNYGVKALEGVDFDKHNNCIRLANSKNTNTDFSGFSLGTIEAGQTASREFAFLLKENGEGGKKYWNHDNLRVIVFISTKEGNNWYVNNVVKCPKHGSVDFEYEN